MDKFEILTQTAQILSAVIGRPETDDFVLVEMPVPDCISHGLAAQGMRFIGLLGLVDGEPRSAMAELVSDEAYASLSDVFVLQVMRVLGSRVEQIRDHISAAPEPKDDFVAFASALLALPDSRD
jgi:hypothetical protein